MTAVARSCIWCKSPFTARSADVRRGWARFCSKSCKAKSQTTRGSLSAFERQSRNMRAVTPQIKPQWVRDEEAHDEAMHDATSDWDEGGWLSDDSGCSPR